MYRIMYMSKANKTFSEKEFEELLNKARISNKKKNITGLLVIKGRTFLQCLEGEKNNVLEIFEKIKKDPRHEEIFKLVEDDAQERYFPDWSMGYKDIKFSTNIKSEKLKNYSTKIDFGEFSQEDIPQVFKEFIICD